MLTVFLPPTNICQVKIIISHHLVISRHSIERHDNLNIFQMKITFFSFHNNQCFQEKLLDFLAKQKSSLTFPNFPWLLHFSRFSLTFHFSGNPGVGFQQNNNKYIYIYFFIILFHIYLHGIDSRLRYGTSKWTWCEPFYHSQLTVLISSK